MRLHEIFGNGPPKTLEDFFKRDPAKAREKHLSKPKPDKYRAKAMKAIDDVIDRLGKGEHKKGWVKDEGDGMFTATFKNGRDTIPVHGHDFAFIPEDYVVTYFQVIRATVKDGGFDEYLVPNSNAADTSEKPARKPRAPDTPEVAAKKRAALANARAAKAAKAGGTGKK